MINTILEEATYRMEKTIASLQSQFSCYRTGRANASMLDGIMIDYYGVQTPINQMAAIKTPDAHLLCVEPWDKASLNSIEKAIAESNIGISPNNDGTSIRLLLPTLTEERRKELVKECKDYAENARMGIRNIRRDANSDIDKIAKEENLSEDEQRKGLDKVQKLTDLYIEKINSFLNSKEAEVMEI
ncbi:MAG: ribosome recycling factor [Eggerthellaceae bacterium]|nr:ribosome recycling factor [Eggerthellaceae bacterium]